MQAILPQGRTKWLNPNPPKEDAEDDDADEEAKEDAVEPEVGPPLLHPLQNDDRACFMMFPATHVISGVGSAGVVDEAVVAAEPRVLVGDYQLEPLARRTCLRH